MNRIHPNKLLHSKWTAAKPLNKEKHFIVVRVDRDEDGNVVDCVIQAVRSKRQSHLCWRALKNQDEWRQGWR